MRFMLILKSNKDSEAGKMPSEESIAAMVKYNQEQAKAGILIDAAGLYPPEQTQKEMVDWLKVSFPRAKIVALIPSASPQLLCADYNIPQSDWAAWVSLFATS